MSPHPPLSPTAKIASPGKSITTVHSNWVPGIHASLCRNVLQNVIADYQFIFDCFKNTRYGSVLKYVFKNMIFFHKGFKIKVCNVLLAVNLLFVWVNLSFFYNAARLSLVCRDFTKRIHYYLT